MTYVACKHPVPAVAAIIVEQGRILLIRRGKSPSFGRWALPGGKVEIHETLQAAVRREVKEEAGIEIRVGEIAGVFDLMVDEPESDIQHYIIIDFFANRVSGEPTFGDDASELRWVPVAELENYDLAQQLLERLRQMEI